MPRKKKASSRRSGPSAAVKSRWAGCTCPRGSRRISTKGRGRGWACQSSKPIRSTKRVKVTRKSVSSRKGYKVAKPFVKAVCRKR